MAIYDIDGNLIMPNDWTQCPQCDSLLQLKFHFNTTEGSGTYTCYNSYDNFVIAHLSDIHSDLIRYERFIKFVQANSSYIDAAIVTGDFVASASEAAFNELKAIEAKYPSVNLIKVVGNHDRIGDPYVLYTSDQVYEFLNMSTNTGKPYYYIDFTSYGIRVIVLNNYDSAYEPKTAQYSQTQIDWLISTLKDAKTKGLAVLIGKHTFEGWEAAPNNKGFYQRWDQWHPMRIDSSNLVCSGIPVEDIIDAFKHGKAISQTYTYTDGTPSITVDTSFSGNGDFIAYMNGHCHMDLMGYSRTYSDQLYLNVSIGSHGATNYPQLKMTEEATDIPRDDEKNQDLFNVYGIDKKNRIVKVCRVGADVNDILEERKVAVFEY